MSYLAATLLLFALPTAAWATPAAQEPQLLPLVPDGWRFEHLDFPLTFAPELEFTGFEELAFAPGMFTPGSDSYFSYALDLRLDGDVAVDAAFVESFLSTYFHGLFARVAEARGLELDLEGMTTAVARRGSGFTAAVHGFDAFTTGATLDLRVELDVLASPHHTELFGLASALPRAAPIWETLTDLRDLWYAERDLPVFLNHLFVVPDAETYAALTTNELLTRTLGAFETRETVRADMRYTGAYWYGRRTYFEFLEPGSTERFPRGASGLAFGVERVGGTDRLAKALEAAGVPSFGGAITRAAGSQEDAEQVPWFRVLGFQAAHATSKLSLFSLEYAPEFLRRWHGDLPPASGGVARRDALARYAAALDLTETRDRGPLLDVSAIWLVLDAQETAHLRGICTALGYELTDSVARGPGIVLHLESAPVSRGITRFDVSLREPIAHAPLELGSLTVRFDGATASFELAP